jgi:succinyl-diaminopimelate desuccinylase
MNFEKAKEYLKQILRFDSVESVAEEGKPFGRGVNDCLMRSLEIMRENGFSTHNADGYCGWGEIGSGELFGILCHLDVVPAGKGWHYDPFGAVEENNKIYARGALDDKSPFIGVLCALTRLLDEGRKPTKRVRIILGCNEESGWKCMDRYKKTEEMPVAGFSPDADFPVINCEKGIVYHSLRYPKPDGLEYIKAGERPNMVPDYAEAKVRITDKILRACLSYDCVYEVDGDFVTISAKGVAAHGSHPEDGKNALIYLLEILSCEYKFAKKLFDAFALCDGSNAGLKISDAKSGALTLNLGTAKTVGGILVFELDVRHPVTATKDYVTEMLKTHLDAEITQDFFHLPLYVDKDNPLVAKLLAAYNKVMRTDAKPIAVGGGTYARVLPLGVAFGPCFPNSPAGIHCADEYVDLDEFRTSIEIYYEALKLLCFE